MAPPWPEKTSTLSIISIAVMLSDVAQIALSLSFYLMCPRGLGSKYACTLVQWTSAQGNGFLQRGPGPSPRIRGWEDHSTRLAECPGVPVRETSGSLLKPLQREIKKLSRSCPPFWESQTALNDQLSNCLGAKIDKDVESNASLFLSVSLSLSLSLSVSTVCPASLNNLLESWGRWQRANAEWATFVTFSCVTATTWPEYHTNKVNRVILQCLRP